MSENKKQIGNKNAIVNDGYQPLEKGYQPSSGSLESSKPPQGGSGVPSKSQTKSSKAD